MAKFTGLAGLTLLAATNALNVDQFLNDAIQQIYQKNGNQETISLEPYCAFTKTTENDGSFDIQGTYGIGRGEPIVFSRNLDVSDSQLTFSSTDRGNFDNTVYGMVWPKLAGKSFETNWNINGNIGDMRMTAVNTGNINGNSWTWSEKVEVANFRQGRSGVRAELQCEGSYTATSAVLRLFPKVQPYNYAITLSAAATKACQGNKLFLSNNCNINLSMTGTVINQNVDFAIDTKSRRSKFVVDVKKNNVKEHTVVVEYNDHELYVIKYKQGRAAFKHVVSVPGPEKLDDIQEQAVLFSEPFVNYFGGIKNGEQATRALVWIDTWWNDLDDQFDCTALAESTGIESAMLAESLGVHSIQRVMGESCVQFNDIAVETLKAAAVEVANARSYVNALTDENDGGAKFNVWYSAL